MKIWILLCVVLTVYSSPAYSEEPELQESQRPNWIERLFGVKERDEKRPAADKSSDSAAETEEDDEGEDEDRPKQERAAAAKKFTDEERELLESWQKGNAKWKKSGKPLPPGLKKKLERGGELPPGWKKKLAVGAVLEPELDQQSTSLPEEILKRLPQAEAGTEILQVGDEIVRVMENTREIVDILRGAGSDATQD